MAVDDRLQYFIDNLGALEKQINDPSVGDSLKDFYKTMSESLKSSMKDFVDNQKQNNNQKDEQQQNNNQENDNQQDSQLDNNHKNDNLQQDENQYNDNQQNDNQKNNNHQNDNQQQQDFKVDQYTRLNNSISDSLGLENKGFEYFEGDEFSNVPAMTVGDRNFNGAYSNNINKAVNSPGDYSTYVLTSHDKFGNWHAVSFDPATGENKNAVFSNDFFAKNNIAVPKSGDVINRSVVDPSDLTYIHDNARHDLSKEHTNVYSDYLNSRMKNLDNSFGLSFSDHEEYRTTSMNSDFLNTLRSSNTGISYRDMNKVSDSNVYKLNNSSFKFDKMDPETGIIRLVSNDGKGGKPKAFYISKNDISDRNLKLITSMPEGSKFSINKNGIQVNKNIDDRIDNLNIEKASKYKEKHSGSLAGGAVKFVAVKAIHATHKVVSLVESVLKRLHSHAEQFSHSFD